MTDMLDELAADGYRPEEFWPKVGDAYWRSGIPLSPEHRAQEALVAKVLTGLRYASVLDVGAGDGRLGTLLTMLRDCTYTALDISAQGLAVTKERIPSAECILGMATELDTERQWDLVVCSEMLMHVPPEAIEATMDALLAATGKALLIIDWYPTNGKPDVIAPWCFYHTDLLNAALGPPEARTGEQGIWLWRP